MLFVFRHAGQRLQAAAQQKERGGRPRRQFRAKYVVNRHGAARGSAGLCCLIWRWISRDSISNQPNWGVSLKIEGEKKNITSRMRSAGFLDRPCSTLGCTPAHSLVKLGALLVLLLPPPHRRPRPPHRAAPPSTPPSHPAPRGLTNRSSRVTAYVILLQLLNRLFADLPPRIPWSPLRPRPEVS